MENFGKIPGFPDYQIGELGTVKSFKKGKETFLKPWRGRYLFVNLCEGGRVRTWKVHRLVAIAHIPNPENLPEVNHLDGDRYNCRKDNLEWTTTQGNTRHAVENGLRRYLSKEEHRFSILTEKDVEQIRKLKGQKTQKEIGQMFGVTPQNIGKIQSGKSWKN